MSDDDYTRDEGGKHEGPKHSSPYPLSTLSAPHDLVDVAREIAKADETIKTAAGSKLKVIAKQIQALQDEARGILHTAQRDAELHRAVCQFKRRPGHVYHLYRKPDDTLYFSMLSPDDWGGAPPHAHEGSYRLEADMSWTPVEQIDERDESDEVVRSLLGPGTGQ